MAAFETLQKLADIDPAALSPLQRVLLITDGTLTEILEAYTHEPVVLVKLAQAIVPAGDEHAAFAPGAGEKMLERKILLKGATSNQTYVYAESVIAYDRLGDPLRDDLLHSTIPLGRLWLNHRLETFKELTKMQRLPAGALAAHFGCDADAALLMRSYLVHAGKKPVMEITEYFSGATNRA